MGLSLDSLCTSIFQVSFVDNDAEDDVIVRLVLATVVLVTHPLPPSAIANLIRLEVEEVMSILGSIQPLLILQEDPDQPVEPFHKLLSHLLTSPTRCADERFYIAPGKFHSEIAIRCLKLMNEALESNPSLHYHVTNSATALKYAWTSWQVHLAESREDISTLIPALRRFLEEKFMLWLEASRALGEIIDPVPALNVTISWLREVAKDEQLLSTAKQCMVSIQLLASLYTTSRILRG